MKESVWASKYRSKFPRALIYYIEGYRGNGELLVVCCYSTNGSWDPRNKRERTEGQYKKKRCICGTHSIKGHKERWKYPKWKKKSRRKDLNSSLN